METIDEIQVFTFNELDDKAKEKALDKYRFINVDYDGWCDLDWYENDLEFYGFLDSKVYWSGFASQGDGACFICKSFDVLDFLRKTKLCNKFRFIYDNVRLNNMYFGGNIYHSSMYYHERSTTLSIDYEWYGVDCKYDLCYTKFLEFEEFLKQWIIEKARDIYSSIEKGYDELTSDESVEETIESFGYRFYEDGETY
jgi:hypothetical protein